MKRIDEFIKENGGLTAKAKKLDRIAIGLSFVATIIFLASLYSSCSWSIMIVGWVVFFIALTCSGIAYFTRNKIKNNKIKMGDK